MNFFMEVYKLPEGSGVAIHYVVDGNLIAYQSLEDIVQENLDMPILVFYGTEDWMCDRGARRVMKTEKENFQIKYIRNSGHQITLDNAKELLDHIINDIPIKEKTEVECSV